METYESARKALETCDHNEIEFYRGRISAMRKILELEEAARRPDTPVSFMNVPS